MSSLGIGSVGQAAATTSSNTSAGSNTNTAQSAAQWFLNYMKETPAQRFEDSWLAAHGLTEQQLNKMPAQQREAILKQMANDMKQKVEQKTQASLAAAS